MSYKYTCIVSSLPPTHTFPHPTPLATAEHELSCLYCSCLLCILHMAVYILATLLSVHPTLLFACVHSSFSISACFCPVSQFICTIFPDSIFYINWSSLVAHLVTSPPAMKETWIQSLGREDRLEKEMTTHSSILVLKIPWMEEPGRLGSGTWGAKSQTRLSNFTSLSPPGYIYLPLSSSLLCVTVNLSGCSWLWRIISPIT